MTGTNNPFAPAKETNPSAAKKRWFLHRQTATVTVLLNLGGNDGIDQETVVGKVSHVELGGFMGAEVHLTTPAGATVSFPLAAVLNVADGNVFEQQVQEHAETPEPAEVEPAFA